MIDLNNANDSQFDSFSTETLSPIISS